MGFCFELTTCCVVAVNGKPRMRMMTSPPRDKNACASELLPVMRSETK